jgi:hypothetical protein
MDYLKILSIIWRKSVDYHYRLCSAPLIMQKLIDYLIISKKSLTHIERPPPQKI